MPSGRPSVILRVALEAATHATVDSDEHSTSIKQLGLLNEQWTQSYVGDAVSRHLRAAYGVGTQQPFVTYETSAAWIDYFAGASSPGPYANNLSDKSRFDLTVWNRRRSIEGLIEIKDQPIMEAYSRARDPLKLMGAMRKWPKIKWGIFLFSVRATDHYETIKLDRHLMAKIEKVRNVVESLDRRFKVTSGPSCTVKSSKCVWWSGALIRRQGESY